jgi:hypothetical protein
VIKPNGMLIVSDFVPIHLFSSFMNFIEHLFHLVDKVYGTMQINISVPKYRKIAQKSDFKLKGIENITKHTIPTYRFLKHNFSLHLSKEEKEFRKATSIIEFVSKTCLLKYLILTFKKNDND